MDSCPHSSRRKSGGVVRLSLPDGLIDSDGNPAVFKQANWIIESPFVNSRNNLSA